MPSIPVRWASKYLQLDSKYGKQLTQEKTIRTGGSPKEDCSFGNADDSYVSPPAGYSASQDLFNGILVCVFP